LKIAARKTSMNQETARGAAGGYGCLAATTADGCTHRSASRVRRRSKSRPAGREAVTVHLLALDRKSVSTKAGQDQAFTRERLLRAMFSSLDTRPIRTTIRC
jgi:hypothetical protein